MTKKDELYLYYKKRREECHDDHSWSVMYLLLKMKDICPDVTIGEFYDVKKEFMNRYFQESHAKFYE